jgi:hypothetical protein
MPMPRHGVAGAVIGSEFHLVSGMMQTAGAMTFLDPQLDAKTAVHDVLDLKLVTNAPPASATGETSDAGASSSGGGQ